MEPPEVGRDPYIDFVSLSEPLPEATLRAAAASPDVYTRWRLTEYPFVFPDDVYLQLVNDPDDSVRHVAIGHWPATTEQLDAGVHARPELRDMAIHHFHASLELMNDRPVGASDGPARRRYLDMAATSPAHRRRFFDLIEAVPQDEQLTVKLGDIRAASLSDQ